MKFSPGIPAVVAVMAVLNATPALADLTVEDAWNTWKAQLKAMGLKVAASETRDGDALQIGPVLLSAEFPMEGGKVTLGFAGPRFEALGDGTVRMSMPDQSLVNFVATIKGEGSMSLVLNAEMKDNMAIMAGTPDQVVSDGSVGAADLSLVSLSIDGKAVENASGRMAMQAYRYQNSTTIGDMITVAGNGQYNGYDLSYAFETKDGEQVANVRTDGSVEDMNMTYRLVLPAGGLDVLNLHGHLRDGVALRAEGSTARYSMVQDVTLDGEVLSRQKTEADSYVQSAVIDRRGIDWRASAGAFTTDVEIFQMPAPISVSAASAAARFLMPLLAEDAPQAAALELDLQDFTLNEDLWALVDADGQLPRDPMSLQLDLAGQVAVSHDLVDFAGLEGLAPGAMPVLPAAAELKTLLLSAAGAELTGSGGFTFDASDMSSFPGMPRPEGKVDLMLVGGNALLDKLVAMGLIPEDEAMGARMMMGMFMVPGEGEDTLTSQIEINDQGHVLANGQRLK